MMKQWRVLIALAGLGLLGAPAFAADLPGQNTPANTANPGTVNYIEGSANSNGSTLSNRNVGNAISISCWRGARCARRSWRKRSGSAKPICRC